MLNGKHILIIDDSNTIRLFLCTILTAEGATCDEAATGRQGLTLLEDGHQYDLVLLDLLLPDIDGIQVLQQIREGDDETTVVMLTGMGGIRSATAAVREGADGYIQKQDLTVGGDNVEFFYALDQAMDHRAGLVAQKELQQLKTDFYSMVTHDLRNPTDNVLLILELLLEGSVGPLNEEQRELLSLAYDSAQKASTLINDYLDFAAIDAGFLHIERERADLRVVVETGIRLAQAQAQARQQRLELHMPSEPVIGWVDSRKFQQVLENLLSNAIKYTPEGGQIVVCLDVEDGHAVLQIRDTGAGIAPEQLSALFAKYHRVKSSRARGIRGTGLGLFIVRQIIEGHGGQVWAESEGIPGRGTTFTVRIPLKLDGSGEEAR